jgi:hypothetical protein
MARPDLITQYMTAPLPCVSEQKRLPFRPEPEQVGQLYRVINRNIFDNQLTQPEIFLGTIKNAWGRCNWMENRQRRSSWGKPGTWCQIELYDKWFSPQWFCNTLAHEMVHQWQWDIYRWEHQEQHGRKMYDDSGAHGPSFHYWRECFESWGLSLKISHGQRRWFRHQDLFKC